MKYFLSIDNNYYHRWQTELLIESFKYHSIDNDLIVFIANKDALTTNDYIKNIISHKNKHFHKGFKDVYLNKLNCLEYVVENKIIDEPFCIIHPDMLLHFPIKCDSEKDILFSYDPTKDNFFNLIEKELIKQLETKPIFIPFGNIVLFNNINLEFINYLYNNYISLSKQDSYFARRYSWIYTLIQNGYGMIGECFTTGIEEFEQNLMHHNLKNNFIHYQHGLGFSWNKHQFKRPDMLLSMSGPYESFLNTDITTSSTDYFREIINSYLSV